MSFIKKDGTDRTLNIQPNAVWTHLAQNPSPSALRASRTRQRRHKHLLPVYDVAARRIKSINLDTVTSVRVDGSLLYLA